MQLFKRHRKNRQNTMISADSSQYLSYTNSVIQNTVEYKIKSTMSFRCSEATKQHYSICLFKNTGCTWKGANCVSEANYFFFFLIRGGFHLNFRLKQMKHVHSCTWSVFKEMGYLHWHLNKEGKCIHSPFQLAPCPIDPLKACICAQSTDFWFLICLH